MGGDIWTRVVSDEKKNCNYTHICQQMRAKSNGRVQRDFIKWYSGETANCNPKLNCKHAMKVL